MKRTTIKRGLALVLVLIVCCSPLPLRHLSTTASAKDASIVVTDIASNTAKSFAGSAASTVGEIIVGNILSAFGYTSPQQKFQNEILQSMEEIKTAITEGVKQLSGQLNQIQSDLNALSNYCARMKEEIFAKIDRAAVNSRLTAMNSKISTSKSTYSTYMLLADAASFADAEYIVTEQLIPKIEAANLPEIITYLRMEFTGTSGGAQTPLITAYATYLMEDYPFMHQVYERLMNFAQYCEYELLRASQLYLEYCNFQQAANDGNDSAVNYWKRSAASTLQDLNDGIAEIEALLPTTDYSLVVDGKYHLFSQKYSVDIWFEPDHEFSVDVDGLKELYYPSGDMLNVDEYKRLGQLFAENGSGNKRLLDCINEVAGTSIGTPLWDCYCEYRGKYWFSPPGPAVINLDDYGQAEDWIWSEREATDRVYARHGSTPYYHPGQGNLHGGAQNHSIAITPPTCTQPGEAIYTCVGGGTYTEIIPAIDHTDTDDNGRCDVCDTLMTGDGRCQICGRTEHDNRRDEVLHAVFIFVKALFSEVLLPLWAKLAA